ncbi:hypothetical protein [Paraburkholderia strydomiana]|uniref:hypothetical protein n=1 Tax=Paraburkholderia strydomiana TaxID=1245417 RepID=UPI001BEBE78E|nr:hypothetical protein [Paraburkholderia strydomiana]
MRSTPRYADEADARGYSRRAPKGEACRTAALLHPAKLESQRDACTGLADALLQSLRRVFRPFGQHEMDDLPRASQNCGIESLPLASPDAN